jgi:hypothetical protein
MYFYGDNRTILNLQVCKMVRLKSVPQNRKGQRYPPEG